MAKQAWQKNTIVIIPTYTLEYLSYLKAQGKRPESLRVPINKGTPQEKIYKVIPGIKNKVPIQVANQLGKRSDIVSIMEVK